MRTSKINLALLAVLALALSFTSAQASYLPSRSLEKTGNRAYFRTGNIGIGTTNPLTKFHLDNDGAILAQGTYGSGWTESDLGAGTRLLWYPKKAAFRVGSVSGTQWDDASVGGYSVAMGRGTTASGNYSTAMGRDTTASKLSSTAMGYNTTASGPYSTAMGKNTTASGFFSTAMGVSTTASGYSSTAMGGFTIASGYFSTAMGNGTNASGDSSTAMGNGTNASGSNSTAMGAYTTASGNYSTAMGDDTTASGDYSTAMGSYTTASGKYSTAMGYHTTAQAQNSLAIGQYNVGGGTTDSWVGTDPIFEIGIGTSSSAKANAMTVLKNGNIGIGTTAPTELLDINSDTMRLRTAKTPASATEACDVGTIAWDANFIYVCVATDTWKRSALTTW